ncbi:MAG TPA: nucleoside monophosphate kinase [Candidatus Saccharimonadia bacterium]|nr:nucleoside monophosphate kinase [Candidatus Saccharimonadia bacterium]
MGKLIVLMGPTGAGKSVQGDFLAEDLGGVHLSSGNLLRRDPKAAAMIADGKLAPAAEVERIVGEAVAAVPDEQPIILDGFPRTMSNVRWMEAELPAYGREVTSVVLIELDLETSLKRLGLRERADDAPEVVREKWNEYARNTQAAIEHYETLGLLRRVDGRGDIETVRRLVRAVLA